MAAMRTLKAIMQMGGAGSLRTIRDSDTQNVEWNMEFAVSSSYWDSKRGPGNLQSILQRDEWRRSR
jgi:hypothetical protein